MAVICGPIVRHCNRAEINIWLVWMTDANANADVDVKVQVMTVPCPSAPPIASIQYFQKIKLSAKCSAYLVTARFILDEDINKIYYDVVIDNKGLQHNGLREKICFDNEAYPSLLLPPVHTHLLQASCRKPHDKEKIDQLSAAANLVKSSLHSPDRPTQLMLTGDQIYADDVSPLLLDYLHQLAQRLGFAEEQLPGTSGPIDLSKIALDGRKSIVTEKLGFTTDEGHSHLLTFAEYTCMHLFSFAGCPEGLNINFATYAEMAAKLTKKSIFSIHRIFPFCAIKEFEADKSALTTFSNTTSGEIRKLLANISTYMIFDDHDVTDDWNLTQHNYTQFITNITSKHIYINALCAYWVCQHWGNIPHDVKPKNDIEALAASPGATNDVNDVRKNLSYLWDKDWGYIIKQSPPIIVLDTRTQRNYYGNSPSKLALMCDSRFKSLNTQVKQLPATPTVILVSATPMFGFSLIEARQLKLNKYKEFADREPWIADKQALETLQKILMQINGIKDICVLSGDVHYGLCRRQSVSENKASENKVSENKVTFWQLCSSASCNTPTGGHWVLQILRLTDCVFFKHNTKYLQPVDPNQTFLTTHKNIGSLLLNHDLKPQRATLYCRPPKGRSYEKEFDLVNFREVKTRCWFK